MTDETGSYSITGRAARPAAQARSSPSRPRRARPPFRRQPIPKRGSNPIATTEKKLIHQLIVDRLAADLAVLSEAAMTAHEAAIHEENIPDNKYDTLSLEASYVAQGQANRAREIKRALHAYQNLTLRRFEDGATIAVTALVTLAAEDGSGKTLFIGPMEGGLRLQSGGEEIMVITPGSPLGKELIGRSAGDEVQLGKTVYQIVAVS